MDFMEKQKKSSKAKTFKKNFPLLILTLPSMLYLFVFCYIPLYGLVLPFKNYDYSLGFLKSPWAGLSCAGFFS